MARTQVPTQLLTHSSPLGGGHYGGRVNRKKSRSKIKTRRSFTNYHHVQNRSIWGKLAFFFSQLKYLITGLDSGKQKGKH